jgi:hypothetical protein
MSLLNSSDSSRSSGVAWLALAALPLLGCNEEMTVGGVHDQDPSQQPSEEVDVGAPTTSTPARASSQLTPVWTQALGDSNAPGLSEYEAKITRAAEGGVWVLEVRGDAVALFRVDEQGVRGAETIVRAPDRLPGTGEVRARLSGLDPHAKGPTAILQWSRLAAPGFTCDGQPDPSAPAGENRYGCGEWVTEALVFESANLGAPLRFDPCESQQPGACHPRSLVRSGDGNTFWGVDGYLIREYDVTGSELEEWYLTTNPRDPEAAVQVSSAFADADKLVAQGLSGSAAGVSNLIEVARGSAPVIKALNGTWHTISSAEFAGDRILPGASAGERVLIVPESAHSYQAGAMDIGILRFNGFDFVRSDAIERLEYSNLETSAAGTDSASTVYVATATGDRAAALSNKLTPLLCKQPLVGQGACHQVSAYLTTLVPVRPGVVIARSHDGKQLLRFDVP